MIKLAIVSPCYNEEEVLEDSAARLTALFDELVAKEKISADSFVLFVNDGSKDRTWSIIKKLHGTNPYIKGMNLARNVGHQYAIMAGMMTAKDWSDAVITIDADLQDDLNAIEEMVDAYMQGYDVVYGVKVSRQADPVLKRLSATAFYKLQHRMGVETIYNHADFRFLSRRVLEKLSHYQERNVYLRGIIPLLGFPSTTVDDVIRERTAGTSKYTVRKMFSLALDGITSFSVKPIYGIVYLGGIFVFISILIGIYVLYALISGTAEHGWASLMLSIWFVGGVVLLSIGAVGLYIGKIYKEVNIPLLGFPSTTVDDVIRERTAGTSKYTVRKMFSLALDGITSFSVKPIYGIVYLGGIFVFISILIGIYVLYALISGTAEHGWASLMLSIWFVGGVVLLSIGAVGLYIGKIYKEVKRRPLYNVEEVLYDDQNK